MKTFFKNLFMVAGAVAIVLGIGWLIWGNVIHQKPIQTNPETTEPVPVIIPEPVSKTITQSTDTFSIGITYPEFQVVTMDEPIQTFVRDVKNNFIGWVDTPEFANIPQSAPASLDMFFMIKRTHDTVSVIFNGSEYTGGAHGNSFVKTFVFKNGVEMSLDDVFTVPPMEYLPKLQTIAISVLSDRLGKDALFLDGFKPIPENWAHWYMLENALVVIFSSYQVGPYVIGMPEVTIPFAQLGPMIK